MSIVKNEAKNKNPVIAAVREQLEHRATWLYLLCDEAQRHGLTWEDFAGDAVRRCGLFQGKGLTEKAGTQSLTGLKKTLFTLPARMVFEMKVLRCDEDHLDLDFGYCPLVKAWQKQGCSDEEIARLCDIAMCGDRAIAESFGCRLELPETIANGADRCALRFVRGTGEKTEEQG